MPFSLNLVRNKENWIQKRARRMGVSVYASRRNQCPVYVGAERGMREEGRKKRSSSGCIRRLNVSYCLVGDDPAGSERLGQMMILSRADVVPKIGDRFPPCALAMSTAAPESDVSDRQRWPPSAWKQEAMKNTGRNEFIRRKMR